ncbi:serine protease [Photobacterium makurazakiensis]|uniref:serine protease n=1 Tax=Photobacterium makurazakiensis TaxID=2910234 RepID=UPI003D0A899F
MRIPLLSLALVAAISAPIANAADVTGYVVGGTPVDPADEQSWMASLRFTPNDTAHLCGGSVINKNWVLTAAHCVVHQLDGDSFSVLPPSMLSVMVGTTSSAIEDPAALYAISHVVVHPDYTPNPVLQITTAADGSVTQDVIATALDNDLALLRVGRSFPQSSITPIALSTAGIASSIETRLNREWSENSRPKNTKVSGWGSTSSDGSGIAEALMEAELSFLPMAECFERLESGNQQHYILDSPLNRTKICALPPEILFDADGSPQGFGPDSCKGDSGGPLRAQDASGVWRQIGIVSGGPVGSPVCGSISRPGFYTRVGTYYDWIESTVSSIPKHPVTNPDFIDNGLYGDAKEDAVNSEDCIDGVSGISPTNCSLQSGGGVVAWVACLPLLLLAFVRRRYKNACLL